jgi:hypothetical protein
MRSITIALYINMGCVYYVLLNVYTVLHVTLLNTAVYM